MILQWAYAVGRSQALAEAEAWRRQYARDAISAARKAKQKDAMLRCWRELGLIT